MDMGSTFFQKQDWDNLIKASFAGEELGQRKNAYGAGGLIHALFLSPEVEYCPKTNEYAVFGE